MASRIAFIVGFVSLTVAALLGASVGASGCSTPSLSGPSSSALRVDQAAVVAGVGDPAGDLAVVAINVGGDVLCTGALLAPDVVLTARHCVAFTSSPIACPAAGPQVTGARPPASLRVLVGGSVSSGHEVARGRATIEPPGDTLCGADVALLLLDQPVFEVEPLRVSGAPVVAGGHVTAIGFGRPGDGGPPGTKLLREHVLVRSVAATEFDVGEATCQGDSGGPALDEATGLIVGVVSRGGPACTGADAFNVYTRIDAYPALVAEALLQSREGGASAGSGNAGASSKPPSVLGEPCAEAADCATGVCVINGPERYCSRSCGAADRCPTHFRCAATGAPEMVCLATN
jgi:hypothetical protein